MSLTEKFIYQQSVCYHLFCCQRSQFLYVRKDSLRQSENENHLVPRALVTLVQRNGKREILKILSFPVPLDKGNDGSENEIDLRYAIAHFEKE